MDSGTNYCTEHRHATGAVQRKKGVASVYFGLYNWLIKKEVSMNKTVLCITVHCSVQLEEQPTEHTNLHYQTTHAITCITCTTSLTECLCLLPLVFVKFAYRDSNKKKNQKKSDPLP